ncbi:hypothetical protein MY9_1183 [Bacillus sp. JS]|nr:hypothetical protein MY9_1183 [Bacillus sp. JS]
MSHFRIAWRKRFLLTAKKTAATPLSFSRKRFLKRWFHFTLPFVDTQYVF